jgi:putative heme-binding domain-containing protein
MKLLPFFAATAFAAFAAAAEPSAAISKEHPPLDLKPRQIVTEEDTRKAEELFRDLPTMSPAAAAAKLAELLKDRDIPRNTSGPWFELIARVGGPQELQQIYVGLVTSLPDDCCEGDPGPDFNPAFAFQQDSEIRHAADVLFEAAEKRGVMPASPYQDGKLHLGSHVYFRGPEGMTNDLARLAGIFHVSEDYEYLAALLRGVEAHKGAYLGLIAAGKEAADAVEPICLDIDEGLGTRGALLVLAQIAPERAVKHAGRVLSAPMAPEELAHLWSELLASKAFVERLVAEMPWYLPPPVREAGAKAARAAKLPALAEKLMPGEDAVLPSSEFEDMAAKVRADGNPTRGELVFRGEIAACAKCHALGGAAKQAKYGPDLGQIGTERKLAEILCDTLQPHARITKGYETFAIETTESTVLPGTSKALPKHVFATRPDRWKKIAEWPPKAGKAVPGSAMPCGLTDALSAQEKLDLFAFLQRLGAPGGLDATNRHVPRVWRMESDSPDLGDFLTRESKTGGTDEIESLVNGDLRRADCIEGLYQTDREKPFYAGTRFTVKTGGDVRFQISGIREAWIDAHKLDIPKKSGLKVSLSKGSHRFDVKLNPKTMPESIRVKSEQVEFETDSIWDWPF